MYSGSKRDQYVKLKLEGLREAPLHLAVFTDLNPVNGHGLDRQTMAETLNYSTVSAINHLWLTARTLNIGVGWVSILQDRLVNQTLNVPADWKLTAYLCIGYPKEFTDEPELQRQGWQSNDEPAWVSR